MKPSSHLIEKTALALACEWYEIGRNQGMTSIHKNARIYAAHNVEKFIPKALEILISMLGRSDIHDLMKKEIYDALMERTNDPEAITSTDLFNGSLPDLNVKKLFTEDDKFEQTLIPKEKDRTLIHVIDEHKPKLQNSVADIKRSLNNYKVPQLKGH